MVQDVFPGTILNWIAAQSLDVAFILLVLPTMFLAVAGTLVVRVIFGSLISPGSSVGESKVGAAAEVYAVVLGFIIVIGFSDFQDAKRNVLQEVTALERLTTQARLMSGDTSSNVVDAVGDYAKAVAEHEWLLMAKGQPSQEAEAKMANLNDLVMAPSNDSSTLSQFRLSSLLDEVVKLRVSRLAAPPDPVVAGLIFQVLILGAVLALVTGWFVRGPSALVHVLLSALLSGSVVTVMVLSAQLLYPFTGPVAISAEPFFELAKMAKG